VNVAELGFGQLEACLAHIQQVSDEKRYTFQSRLKQWQKMGFPAGTKVGKGTKAKYTFQHLCQIVVMMQMMRLGLTPERSIHMVNAGWPRFRHGLLEAIDHIAKVQPQIIYAFVHVNALAELNWNPAPWKETVTVDIVSDEELAGLWLGIDETERWDDDEAKAAETKKRGYSSEAWVEMVRMSLADTIVIEMNLIVMTCLFAIEQVVRMDPKSFAPEIAEWRKEHKNWRRSAEAKALDAIDMATLRRDTEGGTFRYRTVGHAGFLSRRLTNRPDLGPEGVPHQLYGCSHSGRNPNGDDQKA
jgi:hypothetical protein